MGGVLVLLVVPEVVPLGAYVPLPDRVSVTEGELVEILLIVEEGVAVTMVA